MAGTVKSAPLLLILVLAGGLVLASGLVLSTGCRRQDSGPEGGRREPPNLPDKTGSSSERPLLTEITEQAGLGDQSWSWPEGTFFMPEIMGVGIAVFDADGDGRLDILNIRCPPPGKPRAAEPKRLYQQQPDGTFLDVSERSGIGDPGFGQGVAIGDADNDGDADVYFANYGPDAFYLNNGDGTFVDATKRAGISEDLWSSSAVFCDYDRDGWLDLYVARYLRYDPDLPCVSPSGARDYCGPKTFSGIPDTLYHNNGNGTFTDVTERAGIRLPEGGSGAKGLGVVCADLTHDGLSDFYVANDGEPNQLWVNQGDGTFKDEAVLRGVAVNRDGRAEAGMGIAIGDANGDLNLDLYVTHLLNENNVLYCGTAGKLFVDKTADSRLALYDLPFTGFGCGFFDVDLDGDLDIAAVNGRVYRGPLLAGASAGRFWNLYAEPSFLFENDGAGVFSNSSARTGGFGTRAEVSRGLAMGDLDGDGDEDLVVSRCDGGLRVFRNDAPEPGAHWLAVRAMTGRRDAIGAEIAVAAHGRTMLRLALPGVSYMSSCDPRARFGLGASSEIGPIEVRWPSGKRERFIASGVDREMTIHEGAGEAR